MDTRAVDTAAVDTGAVDTAAVSAPLRPAHQRTGAGPIGWVGPLLAVLVTLTGLVLLRDAIFAPAGATGWPGDQQAWTTTATTALQALAPAAWMVPLGAALVLVGLYLLGVALRRRTRKVLALDGASGAYLLAVDVARRAAAAAQDVDGVLSASATATRRRVTVSITTTGGATTTGGDSTGGAGGAGGAGGVAGRVTTAVGGSLSALTRPPAVRVRATTTGSGDGPGSGSHKQQKRKDLA